MCRDENLSNVNQLIIRTRNLRPDRPEFPAAISSLLGAADTTEEDTARERKRNAAISSSFMVRENAMVKKFENLLKQID